MEKLLWSLSPVPRQEASQAKLVWGAIVLRGYDSQSLASWVAIMVSRTKKNIKEGYCQKHGKILV